MSRNIKKLIVLFGVVLLLGLVAAACVPADLQDAIRATRADVTALKADLGKIHKEVEALDKYVKDPEITMSERDIKEHVVRGRADFIAFQDQFTKMNKSLSKNITTLVGTPQKVAKGVTIPAKPGIIQGVDRKLDVLLGTPARKAVPAKEDPKTGKIIKAKPAIPAKPGLIDALNEKLDKLVGTAAKPAVPAKIDKKTGKVVAKAIPAVPPKPGAIDAIMKDLADIKARLEKIEKSMAPAPAPAKVTTP